MDNFIKIIKKITIFLFLVTIISLSIYGYLNGWFKSVEALQNGIDSLGFFGVFGFIIFQILQVIVPVVPNQIISIAGVLAFDIFLGFLYNYIGVFIGSYIVFFLGKKYGKILIEKIFSKKSVEKYQAFTEGTKFTKLFAFALICPGFPDDFLCYLAGTSNISFKNFSIIILIGRALSQITYSLFLEYFQF